MANYSVLTTPLQQIFPRLSTPLSNFVAVVWVRHATWGEALRDDPNKETTSPLSWNICTMSLAVLQKENFYFDATQTVRKWFNYDITSNDSNAREAQTAI